MMSFMVDATHSNTTGDGQLQHPLVYCIVLVVVFPLSIT